MVTVNCRDGVPVPTMNIYTHVHKNIQTLTLCRSSWSTGWLSTARMMSPTFIILEFAAARPGTISQIRVFMGSCVVVRACVCVCACIYGCAGIRGGKIRQHATESCADVLCRYKCVHVCIGIDLCVCMHVDLHVGTLVYMYIGIGIRGGKTHARVCMHAIMIINADVCMHAIMIINADVCGPGHRQFNNTHAHTHTHTQTKHNVHPNCRPRQT